MSTSRQPIPEPEILVRSWPHEVPTGARVPFFQRDWVQLVYARSGVMTVISDQGSWVVPPLRAVWVPAGVRHEVLSHGALSLRSLYFHKGPRFSKVCVTVGVTPLACELINHVALVAPLMRAKASDRRLAGTLLDLLYELPTLPLHLPQPKSKEAVAAASLLLDWNRTPSEVAAEIGVSRRTLERRFVEETNLSLGAWRHQAKFIESVRRLASGEPVGVVAHGVGYESASSFISAFRKSFGISPGTMFAPLN